MRLSARMYKALHTAGVKSKRTNELLGAQIDVVKAYLESLLPPGRSLDQSSTDHVFPLSRYTLQDETEAQKAMHYTNLQPLPGIDNSKKGNSLPSLAEASRVRRECWPIGVVESMLN